MRAAGGSVHVACLIALALAAGGGAACPTAAAPAAAAPAPPAPGAPAATRIRLATWNIEWLASRPGEGRVPRSASDYRRLAAIAERIGADVIALQEIDGPAAARRVFDPERYVLHLTGDRDNRQRTGFAVRRGLAFTAHPDVTSLAVARGTRRGADLTVHLDGADVRLLSVHLKHGCISDPIESPREACAILKAQEEALERWIDARAREGGAFAVLGDFNRRFEPPDRFWAAIDDADPPEADLLDVSAGRRPACRGGKYRGFVDHIVLSRAAAAWLRPGSFAAPDYRKDEAPFAAVLSDHCPLRVDLDVPSPAAAPAGSPRPVTR